MVCALMDSRLAVRERVAEVHAQCDEIFGGKLAVCENHSSRVADRVAERHCPEVFDRQHERGGAVGQFVDDPGRHQLGGVGPFDVS